jgi:signal transduction histidine kinase/CheY-like chemotaxis protein
MGLPDLLRQVVATGKPAVSGLFPGRSDGRSSLGILVPITRQGRVIYVLASSVKPGSISKILHDQNLPPGWTASVIDETGTLFARNIDAQQLTGRVADPDFLSKATGDSAIWTGPNFNGVPILAVMQRQHLANWRVTIGIPLSVIEAPLRGTILLLSITGVIALGMAVFLAWQLANSIAVPLRRLALAGESLANGLPVDGVRSSIAEVDAVSRALVQATQDLHARANALAAERAQLAAIIDTVPVGILIADAPGGRLVSGNSQLDRIMRRPRDPGATVADYAKWSAFHPDGRAVEPRESPILRVLNGEPHAELQCLVQRKDGTSVWVQIVGAPIRDTDGTITGGVVAVLDIDEAVRAREAKARSAETLEAEVADRTADLQSANQRLRDEMAARTAAEEQLRQAQKMEAVGQLTGGIAHDFNNLLTIIVGSLDLLRRRVPEGEAGDRPRRLLDNALEGASRAATLTARLLAFSRRQPLSPQPIDGNRLVSGMADLLHRTLGEAIQVETVLAGGLWQTHADANQLENALLNLAVNARDAMVGPDPGAGRGGVLTIETTNAQLDAAAAQDPEVEPGEYVRFAISDTGVGMEPDVAARVFEPFYTTKPPGQGTGLGLSQVHGFVKQSGGHVAIRTAPNEGTTVAIYLPRFMGTEPPAEDMAADSAPLPLGSLTVLVVEDEPGVRRNSTEALRELGHTVLEAPDPAAALRLLDAHPEASLLFTDVVLPQIDGAQLAAEARRRRPGLPVLFTSGYTGDNTPDGAGAAIQLDPGSLLLPKPFTLEELAEKMREAMQSS